ncbi:MAG: hypothetical protein H7246_05940 [Phycisphaerae bacterium]|nr:hypothetical protein [Saprospiraceae bacterium]
MSIVHFQWFAARCLLLTAAATASALFLLSCGSQSTPLDADTRTRIDSIANAQIAKAQVEHDSLCKAAQITQLPHLVDSIKKIRIHEIEEQLKTVPK